MLPFLSSLAHNVDVSDYVHRKVDGNGNRSKPARPTRPGKLFCDGQENRNELDEPERLDRDERNTHRDHVIAYNIAT